LPGVSSESIGFIVRKYDTPTLDIFESKPQSRLCSRDDMPMLKFLSGFPFTSRLSE
jgi:hypothetical protein